MIKLLALRAAPLALRPAVVLIEQAALEDGALVIVAMPLAAMALTMSSLPVHLDYFRSHPGRADHEARAARYEAGLGVVTIAAVAVLAAMLWAWPSPLSLAACIGVAAAFVVEKFADETSRALEFAKAFTAWALVQALRACWWLAPIAAAALGADYGVAFAFGALASALAMIALFCRVSGRRPRLALEGARIARDNAAFFAGALLPALHMQAPRLLVAAIAPDRAHLFLAAAQLCQGVTLIYNVRFQIPYRRAIARRPRLFQRRLGSANRALATAIVAIASCCGAYGIWAPIDGGAASVAVLAAALIADALALALVVAHLGYIHWLGDAHEAFGTYARCAFAWAALAPLGALAALVAPEAEIAVIPAANAVIAWIWLQWILDRHFRRPRAEPANGLAPLGGAP